MVPWAPSLIPAPRPQAVLRGGRGASARPPPLGEALSLWGFPATSINNPPPLPTNSSPFLEKRDRGQGLHAAVCQARGRRPAAGELPRAPAPPSPRRHSSSWELGTLPLFIKTVSRFITQAALARRWGDRRAATAINQRTAGSYVRDARPLLASGGYSRRPSISGPHQVTAQRPPLQGLYP